MKNEHLQPSHDKPQPFIRVVGELVAAQYLILSAPFRFDEVQGIGANSYHALLTGAGIVVTFDAVTRIREDIRVRNASKHQSGRQSSL
jgi:hypothetical protein